MSTLGKTIRIGVAASLMLIGITASTQGQTAPGGMPFGGELRGMMLIRGKLVCAECSLDEGLGPGLNRRKLVQLNHRRGQVVIEVSWVSEPQRWDYLISLQRRIFVRAEDSLFQKLAAEENMFKEVEITSIPQNSTLDISRVTILGERATRGGE